MKKNKLREDIQDDKRRQERLSALAARNAEQEYRREAKKPVEYLQIARYQKLQLRKAA